ncbi:MAG: response regulator transcription factor [Gammaproteobacteria bacterium]|nr:response regulator transcription factor [Gammaproteobacteria bacterium]
MKNSDYILVVDDDKKLTDLIGSFLSKNGYAVEVEHNGEDAVRRVFAVPPRLIVLDLMMPGMDGLAVCRAVRSHYAGPIIMLTALNDDIDEVTGLEVGADDYLGKPVRPRVLLAHIRALLRRCDEGRSMLGNITEKPRNCIEVGCIVVDAGAREVIQAGTRIDFTTSEFDLLWLLASNAGDVLEREKIHEALFRVEYDGLDRTVDLRISRIRKKLGDDPKSPTIIKTVTGSGYLFARTA